MPWGSSGRPRAAAPGRAARALQPRAGTRGGGHPGLQRRGARTSRRGCTTMACFLLSAECSRPCCPSMRSSSSSSSSSALACSIMAAEGASGLRGAPLLGARTVWQPQRQRFADRLPGGSGSVVRGKQRSWPAVRLRTFLHTDPSEKAAGRIAQMGVGSAGPGTLVHHSEYLSSCSLCALSQALELRHLPASVRIEPTRH